MSLRIDARLTPKKLLPAIERLFELSGQKILSIEKTWKPSLGTPVYTVKGKYTTRGWTEWTQGFQFGSAILQFDATGDERFLEIGRRKTVELMASHVSHIGVHDHGFNNVSTYGNLLRLMREGGIPQDDREQEFYELALKVSGAVQAARWTTIHDGKGYIYSFNGPHSLFIDTIRTLRVLAVAHKLGHKLMGEMDKPISLLGRLMEHAETTAKYGVYYGKGRDAYDIRGRAAHESVFNLNDGNYRCPNSQQGYTGFTTWTRGLAWAITGYAEQLEFFDTLSDDEINADCPRTGWTRRRKGAATRGVRIATSGATIEQLMLEAAQATADFYLEHTPACGVPMWDTGAPNLHRLPKNYLKQPADPYNAWEPVDSSAAAIAAQGLIRLGNYLISKGKAKEGKRYRQAGLTTARTIFSEPYLSTDQKHQGLILHSVYHRPNGWDHIPKGQKVPCGESSMWGDYHARELALLIQREARKEKYLTFFGCLPT